jgi:hypothetical protein
MILDCYTHLEQIRSTFPIQSANKFYPQWWKDLPATYHRDPDGYCPHDRATMKTCPGITDLYGRGFMLPLWCDVILEIHPDGFGFRFADETSQIIYHERVQMGNLFPGYAHLKFCSPWRIKTDSDVNFMVTQPIWNFEAPNDLIVPNGVLNFKHQHGTEINMFVRKPESGVKHIELFAGQPLAHFIPLSEEEPDIETYTVDYDVWDHLAGYNHSFLHRYAKEKKIKSRHERD